MDEIERARGIKTDRLRYGKRGNDKNTNVNLVGTYLSQTNKKRREKDRVKERRNPRERRQVTPKDRGRINTAVNSD